MLKTLRFMPRCSSLLVHLPRRWCSQGRGHGHAPSQALPLFWFPLRPKSVVRGLYEFSSEEKAESQLKEKGKRRRNKGKGQERGWRRTERKGPVKTVALSCLADPEQELKVYSEGALPLESCVAFARFSEEELLSLPRLESLEPHRVEQGLDFRDVLHDALEWELSSTYVRFEEVQGSQSLDTHAPAAPHASTIDKGEDGQGVTERVTRLLVLDGRLLPDGEYPDVHRVEELLEEVEAHGSEDLLAEVSIGPHGEPLPETYIPNDNHTLFSSRGLGFTQVSEKCLKQVVTLIRERLSSAP